MSSAAQKKVAILHDWITGMRGGEQCLAAFLKIYPNADIFTLIHLPGKTTTEIDARVVKTSWLNSLPLVHRYYRALLPLFPLAIRSFDLRGYQLVISLSHAAVKNVTIPEGVPHICYCFTPMRYIWDQLQHYFGAVSRVVGAPLFALLRWWDVQGSKRVTLFVAISPFVGARIRLFYKRKSVVISPPVRRRDEISSILTQNDKEQLSFLPEKFFLCAGALVPYKRIEVAVRAFAKIDHTLVVAGTGSELLMLQKLAREIGARVLFLGRVSDAALWSCYERCQALIFPGIEDFGIVPLECMAAGRPVIGVNAGGLRSSVLGYRVESQTDKISVTSSAVLMSRKEYGNPDGVRNGVSVFNELTSQMKTFNPRENAENFSYEVFYIRWREFCIEYRIFSGESENLTKSSKDRAQEC